MFCDLPAVDAHHIFDRKLFEDGGYYLNNGAAVCEHHHLMCEQTLIPLPKVYESARITDPVLPPGFDLPVESYDKWGNVFTNDGWAMRKAGPLANDTGCQTALKRANLLWTVSFDG